MTTSQPSGRFLAALMLLGTAPVAGQTLVLPIAIGETVQGKLEASDPLLTDGSRYDLYLYRGQSGEQLTLTLRSAEFDAYLAGGRIEGSSFVSEDNDDDGGGGTDARITVSLGASGVYAIQVNSYDSGATGAYSLTLERGSPPPTVLLLPLTIGETVNARLVTSDPKMDDGSHYHLYMVRGRAGQRVVVTLRSEDFDSYLSVGHMDGASFVEEDSDDDGGGDTNARLEVTIPESGQCVIRANSLDAAETGAYTLLVQPNG